MTSVAFLPPSDDFPNGLIISGSQDAIVDVREPGKAPDANAERLLIGHSHNVCALDVSPDGKWIVSGSWDQTAKIWEVGKWTGEITLEGHKGSVWSVLAYSEKTIITGWLRASSSLRGSNVYSVCGPHDPGLLQRRQAHPRV